MRDKEPPFWYPDLRAFVAFSMLGIFASVVGMLLIRPMPMTEQAGTVLLTIVGMIIGKVGTIVDYYFGSNKEAKDQAETGRSQAAALATMAATPPVAVVAPVIPAASVSDDEKAWTDAIALNTVAAFDSYLARFPNGAHAAEAKGRTDALRNV